jgi:Flp pilus assembly protein TadG
MIRFRAHLPSFRPDNAGTAAIEFALVSPFFLVLLLGMVELGFGVYQAMEAWNAAEAGAIYAAKYGFSAAGISAAVVNAEASSGVTASPAPILFCGCPSDAGVTTLACNSTCTGGITPSQYVQVNASIPHQTILAYPGLLPATLTAKSIVRVQ